MQAEFERNLPFAQSVASSATHPANPDSVSVNIKTKPFYLESDDPYKRGIPGANFTFSVSYGDPQPVAVIAKRSLGAVTRMESTAAPSSRRRRRSGRGERYTPAGSTTTRYAAWSPAPSPTTRSRSGSRAVARRATSFTYTAVSETGHKVLVVAAEDYTGASPANLGPKYTDSTSTR